MAVAATRSVGRTREPVSALLSKPGYWYYVLGVLTLCYVANVIDRSQVLAASLQAIKSEFGASDFQLGMLSPLQGIITETPQELRGQRFKDKILVCRGATGSSGWSAMYHITRLAGTAPNGIDEVQKAPAENPS